MTSWLKSQKKADLLDLAEEAGLDLEKSLKKDEIASSLEAHLKQNATSLSTKTSFSPYYSRQSPIKRESTSGPVESIEKSVAKPRQRRQTKLPTEAAAGAEESIATTARKAISSATPKSAQQAVNRINLPATPKVVTDLIERSTSAVTRRVSKAVKKSGFDEHLESSREYLSTVHAIHILFVLLESYGLQAVTLPWLPAFQYPVPFAKSIGIDSPRWVTYPNFFVLLEESFWAPTLLWLLISLILPVVLGWAINLTRQSHVSSRRAYPVDPVAFNVSKALLAWLVHARGLRFGIFSNATQVRVEAAMPTGSYTGVLIETAVGGLAGLYEAVLRK